MARRFVVVLVLLAVLGGAMPAQAQLLELGAYLITRFIDKKASEPMDRSTTALKIGCNVMRGERGLGPASDLDRFKLVLASDTTPYYTATVAGKPHLIGQTKLVTVRCDWKEIPDISATPEEVTYGYKDSDNLIALSFRDGRSRVVCPEKKEKEKGRRHRDRDETTRDSKTLSRCQEIEEINKCLVSRHNNGIVIAVPMREIQPDLREYTLSFAAYFGNGKKQGGDFFGISRVTYEDSGFGDVLMDVTTPAKVAEVMNDPDVQRSLSVVGGISPSIPIIGGAKYQITNPDVQHMLDVGGAPVQTQQQQPQTAPAVAAPQNQNPGNTAGALERCASGFGIQNPKQLQEFNASGLQLSPDEQIPTVIIALKDGELDTSADICIKIDQFGPFRSKNHDGIIRLFKLRGTETIHILKNNIEIDSFRVTPNKGYWRVVNTGGAR